MSSQTPVMSADNKYGEKLNYDPEFRGPVKDRSCTDILCLFLFVAFLAGWCVVGFFAVKYGDPKTLLYPTDSAGNICGVDKLESKPYLFFFDLLKCATPGVVLNGCPTPQVCVEKCPDYNYYASPVDPNPAEAKKKLICKYHVDKDKSEFKDLIQKEDCAQLYLKSRAVLGRCIPTIVDSSHVGSITDEKNKTLKQGDNEISVDEIEHATHSLARFLSVGEFGAKVFADLKTSWKYILVGLIVSMIISLIFIILMRWLAGPMIYFSILFILVFLAYACYYSTTRYQELKELSAEDTEFRVTLRLKTYLEMRKTWLTFAILSGSIFGILFLIIICLRKRIAIAVALIKEGSKAVANIPTSLVFPLLPYLLMVVFFAVWIGLALFISSSGKPSYHIVNAPPNSDLKNLTSCDPKTFKDDKSEAKCMFKSYGLKNNIFSAQFYNLFGLFWGLFFAVGIGQVSLSGAFSTYYWTPDKRNIPTFTVLTGLYRCLRYHLGSIAFGSLLLAIVRTIRVMLEYADKKLKKYDNAVTRAILCCMRCFFWCLEKVLKFINKNAYIMIAIYGHNFCTSARKAFMLVMRNILRVVVLDKLTDFLLLFGKLVVVTISGVASFYIFSTDQQIYKGVPALNYNVLPVVVITIGAYLIASGFFSVYGMAVDTLFLCFLEDCERNDGSPEKPYLMSKELMKILHKKNKFQELSSPTS